MGASAPAGYSMRCMNNGAGSGVRKLFLACSVASTLAAAFCAVTGHPLSCGVSCGVSCEAQMNLPTCCKVLQILSRTDRAVTGGLQCAAVLGAHVRAAATAAGSSLGISMSCISFGLSTFD